MDMPEDEHFVGAPDACADMTFGQGPDTTCGEDAVRLSEPLAQVEYFGFYGGCCVRMNGPMLGHEWMLRRRLATTTVADLRHGPNLGSGSAGREALCRDS